MMLKEEERWRREVPNHPGLRVIGQRREKQHGCRHQGASNAAEEAHSVPGEARCHGGPQRDYGNTTIIAASTSQAEGFQTGYGKSAMITLRRMRWL
jgi:hypothetical protein